MRNGPDEAMLIAQSLSNLRFMIELQVLNTMQTGSVTERGAADLRRLLDLDEALRCHRRRSASAETCLVAA